MKIFLAQGYNSFTNRHWYLLADDLKQAENAVVGLTDPKILMFQGQTKLDAATKALRAVTKT